MCEYCEKGKTIKVNESKDNGVNHKSKIKIGWEDCVPSMIIEENTPNYWSTIYVNIVYCPWCGRNMNE